MKLIHFLLKIPRGARSTFYMWANGFDVKKLLTYSEYEKHKKILLAYGIDITRSFE